MIFLVDKLVTHRAYLTHLANAIREIPVMHGLDGGDVDSVRDVRDHIEVEYLDKCEIVHNRRKLSFKYHHYKNLRYRINLHDDQDIPWATLTVNIPEEELGHGEFIIKTYSENEHIAASVLASGLFRDTRRRINVSYNQAQVWVLAEGIEL